MWPLLIIIFAMIGKVCHQKFGNPAKYSCLHWCSRDFKRVALNELDYTLFAFSPSVIKTTSNYNNSIANMGLLVSINI